MLPRPVTSEDLERLRRERDEADRAYNDALTALDRAVPRAGGAPSPPPPLDETLLPALNERWRVVPDAQLPPRRGLRTRLLHFVWNILRPALERQQAFNAALVEHLNRNVRSAAETPAALAAAITEQRDLASALAAFHSHLIVYLQQVTAYVDTKDRAAAGGLMAVYDAAVNGIASDLLARWESLGAREARLDGKVTAVAGAHDELRSALGTVQQATLTVKRELERLLARPAGAASPADASPAASPAPSSATPVIDSYKYVGFEDRFRGSTEEIRRRLTSYVEDFRGASDVLDVGCGRGELLDLLREAGIPARGLDLNHEMVEVCRERGLDVDEGDLLGHLEGLPDASLGGLIAVQVVEHLEPSYLMRALDVAYHKLRPGAPVILETINPACWFAFFSSYIRDLTHVRPIHPDTLQYLLTASGFQRAEIRFRAPYPDHEKLQPLAWHGGDPALADMTNTFNANVERLNALLFTHLDYAAVGVR